MGDLSADKRRLLEQRLGKRPAAQPAVPVGIPRRPDGPPPLSAGQEAIRFAVSARPLEPVYNVVHQHLVDGPFDPSAFETALRSVVERHESLITSFGTDRRTLDIVDAVSFEFLQMTDGETTDDDASDSGDALARFERIATDQATTPFDLVDGPLLRCVCVALGPDRHGLVLALHHLSADAASFGILWRELDLSARGRPITTPSVRYSDHAVWQRSQITDDDRTFWAERLPSDAVAPRPDLAAPSTPTDADRRSAGYLTVPLGVTPAALADAGLRSQPFFLACLADLLDRYDAAALEEPAGPGAPTATTIGIAGSVRDHPELDDVIGYFLNTLPLSVPVDRDTTIADRVTAVEGSLATALRHRHVPYHEIVSARRANGDREPDPISVLFVVDETFDASFGDAEVTSDLVHNGTAVAPLTMFVRPVADGFEASAEWDTTQFDGTRVAAFLDSFTILTEWASRHSDEPIPATLLADDAVGPPLADSATTLTHTIVDAIDGNGADPEALAVRCGDQRLSWGELRDRSDRWARALAERHVGRGDRVVVALPRSIDLIVAIVGVLRSGACVVPIDATSPTARIDAVIDATGSTLAIDPTVAQALDDATPSDSTPGSRPRPDDDAYVIFTSGSTGRPRGVPVRHRELIASTAARLDRYAERPSTYLLTSSIGFDSSAAGLYWTLLVGGALALPTDDEVHDVDALLALAADASISHLLTVPSMYDTLLRRHPERLGSLQRAIVAGEACPPAVARRHHDVLPTAELTNEYGPSEATVWASAHDVAPTDDPVPIGRPIPGVRLRVVDRSLRARPPGLPGELVIAGPGVTRGYLDDEPATAASFPTDSDGNRWYRTGDLVRREGDVFTFLGRVDHQLSIGGVRLEPEEIESVIASVPGVTAAIVRAERRIPGDVLSALRELPDEAIARVAAGLSAPGPVSRDDDRNHEVDDDRSDGSPRAADRFADLVTVELAATAIGSEVLVAHVEAASDTDPDDVRRVVADTLPGHAVPAFVQIHEALPRTPNGKVDRHALGPPVRAAATDDGSSTYGQRLDDAGVELVVAAFRSVLGRDDIGPDTDFFDVGDSLSAVELATDLEEQVGRRVAIGLLLAARTPRAIAVALDLTDDSRRTPGLASDDSLLVELKPGRRVRSTDGPVSPLLVMPHAGGNLVPFDGLVQALDDRLPVIGFELPGARHDDEFPESLGALVDRYLDELLVAHPTGPYRFLGWSFGGVVALELARRLEARGEIVDLVAMIDTLVPGMQRSDRGAAYREAYADGGVGAVAQRIGRSLAYRAEYALGEIRGRRAARTGERLSAADRNTWLTIRIDEIVEAHPPPSWGGPVLYFAAIDTPRQRSTGPWADLLTGLEIVDVDGHHDGPDGLLASHTDELARTLSDRLV